MQDPISEAALKQASLRHEKRRIRILMVEDVADHADLISSFLRRMDKWLEVEVASSVEEGIGKAEERKFDLLLSDYQIGPIDCFALLRELSERGVSLPVIILTGQGNEQVAAEAISRGAEDYLIKDVIFREPSRLLKAISSAVMRQRLEEALRESEEKYRTLVQNIMDGVFLLRDSRLEFVNPAFAAMLDTAADELQKADFVSLFAPDQEKAVTDFLKASWAGGETHEAEFILKSKSGNGTIYVTIKLSKCTYGGQPTLIGTVKDITKRKITEQKLQQTLIKLETLSITDDLTNVFNRRHLLSVAEKEVARSQRYSAPLSLIMLDIDKFKEINDTYGHICGDDLLVAVAKILSDSVRAIDTVARYGGDEFIIVLPQTDSRSTLRLAERIRNDVEAYHLPLSDGQSVNTTVSLGITELKGAEDSLKDLIKRADDALLMAKDKGRNFVEVLL